MVSIFVLFAQTNISGLQPVAPWCSTRTESPSTKSREKSTTFGVSFFQQGMLAVLCCSFSAFGVVCK